MSNEIPNTFIEELFEIYNSYFEEDNDEILKDVVESILVHLYPFEDVLKNTRYGRIEYECHFILRLERISIELEIDNELGDKYHEVCLDLYKRMEDIFKNIINDQNVIESKI